MLGIQCYEVDIYNLFLFYMAIAKFIIDFELKHPLVTFGFHLFIDMDENVGEKLLSDASTSILICRGSQDWKKKKRIL